MTQPTILVTGATGTVGSLLTEQLVAGGHTVHAATRHPERWTGAGATPVQLELGSPESIDRALDGVHRLFILSPNGGHDDYALLSPLLQKAIESATVDRIVLMTAQGVETHDQLPLRRLERLLEKSGKAHGILRPTWFNQDFHTFWGEGVRHQDRIDLPAAEARVAFIDARDIASCAIALLTTDQAPDAGFTLTGPEALTFSDAAAILSDKLDRRITYHAIEEDAFRTALEAAGTPLETVELMIWLFADLRAGAAAGLSSDVERLLGRTPLRLEDYAQTYSAALSP